MKRVVLECASPAGRYPTRPTTSEDAAMNSDDRERILARFWLKVNKTDTCWLWTGERDLNGYGKLCFDGKRLFAHRVAYELLVGRVPDGLELDHVACRGCTNRHCVNPGHLEPVTHRENVLRGVSPPAKHARQTECHRGHPLSGSNLVVRGAWRDCGECRRLNQRARRGA